MNKTWSWVAAMLWLAALGGGAYANDTIAVVSNVDTNHIGASADIVTTSNGVSYLAYIDGTNIKVVSNAGGSFSQIDGNIALGRNGKLVSIGLTGYDTPVVAVIEDSGPSADTVASVYIFNGTSFALESRMKLFHDGADPQHTITSLDVIGAGDSWVIIALTHHHDASGVAVDDSGIKLVAYGLTSSGTLAMVDSHLIMLGNGGISAVDVEAARSEGIGERGARASETQVAIYVAAFVVSDSAAAADTGLSVFKIFFDTNIGFRDQSQRLRVADNGKLGNLADIGMAIDNKTGSDTQPRVTLVAAGTGGIGIRGETFVIYVLGGDSGAASVIGVHDDTIAFADTGIQSFVRVSGIQSVVLGRNSGNLGMIWVSNAGSIFRATGVISGRDISWSGETLAVNIGYADNDTNLPSRFNAASELVGKVMNGTLYAAGYTESPFQTIFYLAIPLADGGGTDGRCLLNRIVGNAAASTCLPVLRSLRDSLLTSAAGRAFVASYYTFR